jgi:hypothetical protein
MSGEAVNGCTACIHQEHNGPCLGINGTCGCVLSTGTPIPPVRSVRDHIEQFFDYAHLPADKQAVSKLFGDLAKQIVETIPRNPERTVALRKLLEAKDAAVRASFAKDV